MASSTPPKSSLAKLVNYQKPKPFKVMVLGQAAIGKTALVVRFITRRFIGDYDPTLEQIYTFNTVIDNEMVNFEILDSAGELREGEIARLEANIRWAEAFVLMYSVTDKCSFDECHRLKFLINYNKRRWRLASSMRFREDSVPDIPVVLVGNKNEIAGDRMVSTEEGKRRSKEIGCVCFHEIAVRESIEQCFEVFRDVRRFWRVSNKCRGGRRSEPATVPRPLQRANSDEDHEPAAHAAARRWPEDLEEEDEWISEGVVVSDSASPSATEPPQAEGFRARASTESRLPARIERPRDPRLQRPPPPLDRRTSVAMRGNTSNAY